tara:strand:+ start:50 stop:850 length:801 start_codon:yes stop_codon:yes gene_type:complete
MMNTEEKLSDYILKARILALKAGKEIMKFYSNNIEFHQKPDKSPITLADRAADKIITNGLNKYFPKIPIISEESVENIYQPKEINLENKFFWLVDPLDGTKEFINKNDEFTVNIGLIKNGKPWIGVLYLPVKRICYVGEVGVGAASWLDNAKPCPISVRSAPSSGPVILASRSHINDETQRWINDVKPSSIITAGSALKFALLASGNADIYPRFGPTMEWDTAAGHAILEAAGGSLFQPNNKPLIYGKPGYKNPHFIACGATNEKK